MWIFWFLVSSSPRNLFIFVKKQLADFCAGIQFKFWLHLITILPILSSQLYFRHENPFRGALGESSSPIQVSGAAGPPIAVTASNSSKCFELRPSVFRSGHLKHCFFSKLTGLAEQWKFSSITSPVRRSWLYLHCGCTYTMAAPPPWLIVSFPSVSLKKKKQKSSPWNGLMSYFFLSCLVSRAGELCLT